MAALFSHGQHDDLDGGRMRTTIGIKPVNYFANGLFRPITSKLKNTGDPNLTVGVDELVQFRLRDRLTGNAPLLHFGKGNTFVRLSPVGTNNVIGKAIGENGFEYPGVWNGADLRFVMGGHRLQKDIVLRAGHPPSFSFRIDSHAGLDLATLATPDFRILTPVLEPPTKSAELARPLKWVVSQSGGKTVLTANLPPGDWAGWTLDPTLTLQPGVADGVDARIIFTLPDTNFGAVDIFVWGNAGGDNTQRTLVKFDLSALPDNANITSCILSVYITDDYSTNARTARVFRQKRSWVEAQVTWNIYSTGNNWQTAGGFGANDCEQTDIGSRNLTASETLSEFKDFPLTPTTKAALDLGNGWLVKADVESSDMYVGVSSDNATAANRPKLVVEYSVVGGFTPIPIRPMTFDWSWWR